MKPYRISVPIMNHSCDTDEHRAQFLEMVKRAGASRIFLVMERYFTESPAKKHALSLLKTNIRYLKENGIETVGTWFTGMGHGAPLDHEGTEIRADYTRLVSFSGEVCDDTFCIADEGYRRLIASYVRDMGACGADIIQLDDDLRLGYRPNGIGCTCEYHMREFARRTGKEWTRSELYEAVYSGGPNAVRDAWFALMAEGFMGFAKTLRDALDTVSPTTQLGFCAGPTTFDQDCFDAAALSRAFAGKTKPFLRGAGAPYWDMHKGWERLEDAISYQRMQRAWVSKAPDIEFFSEGDVYPRPRYRVPAWLLETYDTALRADGSTDGILKYVFDYVQSPAYEMGYLKRHLKNAPLYREIENAFGGENTRGIFVYEEEHKLLHADLPVPAPAPNVLTQTAKPAIRAMNRMCIPISFQNHGDAVCVMGESARNMDLSYLENGAILDISAAQILIRRGVDCGILSIKTAAAPEVELFPKTSEAEEETLRPLTGGMFYHAVLSDRAEVLSEFRSGDEIYPAVWFYENDAGKRFLCYAFDMNSVDAESQLLCSYARQAQFIRAAERLQKYPLAAVCTGNPRLYMIVKDREDGSRAVGLWNCFDDEILTPHVTLSDAYTDIQFLNGAKGTIDGNEVFFETDIPAHSFAGFVVTK